jgi:demethoxyubiquinone hydroxylase (CLK1/Coq7/Cat5 family)
LGNKASFLRETKRDPTFLASFWEEKLRNIGAFASSKNISVAVYCSK